MRSQPLQTPGSAKPQTTLSIQGPVGKKPSAQMQVATTDVGQMINFNQAISGSVRADSVLSVYSKGE